MLGGEIKVVMTLDNGQFTIQTQRAGQVIQEMRRSIDQTATSTKKLENHFTGLRGHFRELIQTASMLRYALHDIHDIFMALPGAVLKTSGEFERLSLLMEGMSKEVTTAGRKLEALTNKKYILDLALSTPFDIKTLTDGFVKFKSAGLDPTDGSFKGLVESVARFGGTSEQLHRASIAIQQMAGKGVLSMEELRQQLGEAVPNAINLMAEGMGVSMAKLTKAVSTGTVEAKGALKTLFTVMQIDNYGASQAMMESWTGLLAQLKTKFELFKDDIGKGGFFDEMKKQVQDIIDLFDTPEAKAFAYDLGQGLKDLVQFLRSAVEWFDKWAFAIKGAGIAFATYFAVKKFREIADALKGSKLSEAYGEGSGKVSEKAGKEAQLIRQKAAFNEMLYRENQEAIKKELALLKDANVQEIALTEKRIAAQQQRTAALRVEQQNELNLARDLMAKKAALIAQADALDLRTDAGRFRAKMLMDEANAMKATIAAHGDRARAIAADVNRSIDATNALERHRQGLINNTASTNANIKALEAANSNIKQTIDSLNRKADAVAKVSFGMRALHGTISAGKVIWDAFGGWVGIAIGVLTTLGTLLYEYMNRWKEFDAIVQRTKSGVASEESRTQAETRLAEIDALIKSKQRTLAGMKGDDEIVMDMFGTPIGIQSGARAAMQAEIDKLLAQRKDIADNIREQGLIIQEQSDNLEMTQIKRQYERQNKKIMEAWESAAEDIRKRKLDALEKAEEGGKKLTEAEKRAISAPFDKELNDSRKNRVASVLEFLKNEIDDINRELDTANITSQRRNELKLRLQVLAKEKTGLREEFLKLRDAANESLGKGIKTTAKPKDDEPVDPFLKYVLKLENDFEEARQKLQANVAGIRGLAEMRNEAVIKVLGDMAEGKFDKPLDKDEDGAARRRYEGDLQKRQDMVREFAKALREGRGDAEAFIRTLPNLSEEAKKLALRAVEAAAGIELTKEQTKAFNAVSDMATRSSEDLDAALIRLANGGMAAESSALLALKKQLAVLEDGLKGAESGFEAFEAKKRLALQNTVGAGLANFSADAQKQLREAQLAATKLNMTAQQSRDFNLQEELDAIQKREDEQKRALAEGYYTEVQYEMKLRQLRQASDQLRSAAMLRWQIESETALQRQARTWNDSLTAMNQATANWASQTMDYITRAINGEKVGAFRTVFIGMLKDLNSILIKNVLGGAITGMFGSIGDSLTGILGLGKTRGESPTAPMYVQEVGKGLTAPTGDEQVKKLADQGTQMWDKVKDGAMSMWESAKSGLSGIWDSLSTMFSGLFGGGGTLSSLLTDWISKAGDWMSSLISGIGGGGGDLVSTVASLFGFAKGGVMTSSGSMPLRKYGTGGVADRPQLAMFGEGATPEAYVPLPDGRTIPVTIAGGMPSSGGNMVNINIVVNKDGDSKQSSEGDEAQTWQRVAQRVRGVVMEELVVQQRPGGVLSK